MLDLSSFSDPVEIPASAVCVGDHVEYARPTYDGSTYAGSQVSAGIVTETTEGVGIDGKIRLTLEAPIGETKLRVEPGTLVVVRRPH